jgi:hypothetical protein
VVFRHPREPVRGFDCKLAEDLHPVASPLRIVDPGGRAVKGINRFGVFQRAILRSAENGKSHLELVAKLSVSSQDLQVFPR